jgi:hypothetical protein
MRRLSMTVVTNLFAIAIAASVCGAMTVVRPATPGALGIYGSDTHDPPPVGNGGACNETSLPNCNYPNPSGGCNISVSTCLATIQNPQGTCRRSSISTPCTQNTACAVRYPHECD